MFNAQDDSHAWSRVATAFAVGLLALSMAVAALRLDRLHQVPLLGHTPMSPWLQDWEVAVTTALLAVYALLPPVLLRYRRLARQVVDIMPAERERARIPAGWLVLSLAIALQCAGWALACSEEQYELGFSLGTAGDVCGMLAGMLMVVWIQVVEEDVVGTRHLMTHQGPKRKETLPPSAMIPVMRRAP
jgi:hypothetical protein